MFYSSIIWYIFCFISGLGCFIHNFGKISLGRSKETIQFIGSILFFVFIILSFFVNGWKGGVVLIVVELVLIVPIVNLIIPKIENKLYGHYKKFEEDFANKLGITVDEMHVYKDMNIEDETKKMGIKKTISRKRFNKIVDESLIKDKINYE